MAWDEGKAYDIRFTKTEDCMAGDVMSKKIIAIVAAVIIVLAIVLYGTWWWDGEDTITVKKMYIDNSGDESHYMIVDTDGNIWEMDAVWLHGSFGIDRQWAKLEVNHTYDVEYCGWDLPALDYYYIIYHVEEVNTTGGT